MDRYIGSIAEDQQPDAKRYRMLRDYLLLNGGWRDRSVRQLWQAVIQHASELRSTGVPLVYFMFDVVILAGRDVTKQPLEARQELLQQKVQPKLAEPDPVSGVLKASLPDLIKSVKVSGLEGLVAKRRDSLYEVGSAFWLQAQDAHQQGAGVRDWWIYLGGTTLDALIFGYHDGGGQILRARRTTGHSRCDSHGHRRFGTCECQQPQVSGFHGQPLLLEDLLAHHPKLRVQVMHAGYPMMDNMLTLLQANSHVYVEIAGLIWSYPIKEVNRYIERLVDAGFEDRVMFGTDQMEWPKLMSYSISIIQNADYLTPGQKRDILYNNAARFYRLDKNGQH